VTVARQSAISCRQGGFNNQQGQEVAMEGEDGGGDMEQAPRSGRETVAAVPVTTSTVAATAQTTSKAMLMISFVKLSNLLNKIIILSNINLY
jgi:hypothetical protein